MERPTLVITDCRKRVAKQGTDMLQICKDETKWVCRITSHISSRLTNGLVSFRVHTARTGAKEFVCEVVARKVEEENIDDDDLILTIGRQSRPWSLACRSIIPTTPGPCMHLDDMNKAPNIGHHKTVHVRWLAYRAYGDVPTLPSFLHFIRQSHIRLFVVIWSRTLDMRLWHD